MTSPNEQQRVDVLAVMDDVERGMRSMSTILADDMRQARAAVAELIEAVIKNREATQEFANDGQPDNYRRWDASERRLLAALANVGAQK